VDLSRSDCELNHASQHCGFDIFPIGHLVMTKGLKMKIRRYVTITTALLLGLLQATGLKLVAASH